MLKGMSIEFWRNVSYPIKHCTNCDTLCFHFLHYKTNNTLCPDCRLSSEGVDLSKVTWYRLDDNGECVRVDRVTLRDRLNTHDHIEGETCWAGCA